VEQAKAMDIIILVRITTNFKYGRHEISSQKESKIEDYRPTSLQNIIYFQKERGSG